MPGFRGFPRCVRLARPLLYPGGPNTHTVEEPVMIRPLSRRSSGLLFVLVLIAASLAAPRHAWAQG